MRQLLDVVEVGETGVIHELEYTLRRAMRGHPGHKQRSLVQSIEHARGHILHIEHTRGGGV